MKASLYNLFVPYKDCTVIYNPLWDTCVMVKSNNLVLNVLKSANKDLLRVLDNNVLDKLTENKFVLDDNFDEFAYFESQLNNTNNNTEEFILTINPTLACNFRCWYCYEEHSNKPHMTNIDVQRVGKIMEEIFTRPNIKRVCLNFFGGEPLLAFSTVVKSIVCRAECLAKENKKSFYIVVTTNGYYLKPDYALFLKEHNIGNYQITLDGNRERHNKVRSTKDGKDTYSQILKNIKYTLSIGSNVIIRINISEETNLDVTLLLDDFMDLSEDSKKHLIFSIQKVWQADSSVKSVIREIITTIRSKGFMCQPFNLSYRDIHRTCYADKEKHLVINPNGEIYGCTARDFNKETIEGRIGIDGNIVFNTKRYARLGISPLQNDECKYCNILPICIGGCKQKILEKQNMKTCMFGFSESEKQEFANEYVIEKLTQE